MTFSLLDWLLLSLFLLSTLWLGLLGKRYVKGSDAFLVAGRSVGQYLGAISLVSTEIGIITYMYYAEMGAIYGFSAFLAGLVPAAVYLFLGSTGFIIKRFREMELVTIPEYFERRYGRGVRVLGGILMAIGGVLNFGVFPVIEATFLNIVTGIPREHLLWTMVFLMAAVLLYTALGGMVSVLLTNYFQYIVLVLAMLVITAWMLWGAGWTPAVESVSERLGEKGFNPFVHPDFGWNFLLWQVLIWLAVLTCWAPVAMRAFASESPEVSKKVFRWTGLIFLGRALLPMLWGILAIAYMKGAQGPAIEATPRMLAEVLPIGIKGLVVAGMLAASMSTYSGYLLAWSSVISEDIIIPLRRKKISPRAALIINRLTVLFLTIFIIVWGLFYVVPGATYFYLQMTANLFLAGTFWAMVGGLHWKYSNSTGAYLGLILGGGATLLYFVSPNPSQAAGTIGVLSYLLALAGMAGGSLAASPMAPRAVRAASGLGVAVLAAGCAAWYLGGGLPGLAWREGWTATLLVAGAVFIALSAHAILRGYGDLRRTLGRVAEAPPDQSSSRG